MIIALNTGMRKGEILHLRWKDIDFTGKIITVWETKGKEKRFIPMNKAVYQTLINLKVNPVSEYVFSWKDEKKHISKDHITHLFSKIVNLVGIDDFRFHDLRHTFASWLVMKGVDLKTIQELLGHKDYKMTLRYAHLFPEKKKLAVDLLVNNLRENAKNGHYMDTRGKINKAKNSGTIV